MKKNIEKFLGKFAEQNKGVPILLTTPHMIEGRVTLGDAQKSIFKKK